jgi:hypothetical protein
MVHQDLENRTEQELRSATDPVAVTVLTLCNGVAELNNGALQEATRDLDAAEGRLARCPTGAGASSRCCCSGQRWSPKAELHQDDRASAYLARAAALTPGEAAGLQRELAQASGASPTTDLDRATATSGTADDFGAGQPSRTTDSPTTTVPQETTDGTPNGQGGWP